MLKTIIASLILVIWFPAASYSGQVGTVAPDFSVPDLSGKAVTLQQLRGKVALLTFWAPWCGPCKEEMPELQALYAKYAPDGFEVIGISVDGSEKSVARFLQEVPLTFTILLDQKGQAGEMYRFSNLPAGYLIGRDGVIRYVHKGFGKEFVPLYQKEVQELLKQR